MKSFLRSTRTLTALTKHLLRSRIGLRMKKMQTHAFKWPNPRSDVAEPPTAIAVALRKEMKSGPNLRAWIGYVQSPPACKNCAHYRKPSIEQNFAPWCSKFIMEVRKTAVCENWESQHPDGGTEPGAA